MQRLSTTRNFVETRWKSCGTKRKIQVSLIKIKIIFHNHSNNFIKFPRFLYEDTETMSLVIKNVTPQDAGTYTVSAKNELGEDQSEIKLTVKAPPKIKKKVEDQSCMTEQTHKMTIEIEGSPTPDVTFFKDGVQITSSERIKITKECEEIYSITIKNTSLNDTGSYSVVAKNEISQCSEFWQLRVTSPPKILQKLGGSKECSEGEAVVFQIKVEADPPPTVKWFKDGKEIVPDSTNIKVTSDGSVFTLSIAGAKRSDAANYSCEVTNSHGTSKDSSRLNVRCAPEFKQKLVDTKAKEGEVNVELVVKVDAFPKPSIKW